MKAEVLLKMSEQPYTTAECDPTKAPKGKAPVLIDDGVQVPDTTFIRMHLETKYGIDFDAGLNDADRSIAWAFEKLCEDNLYWIILWERWMVDQNFEAGPIAFFKSVPKALRKIVIALVRRQVKRDLHGQGVGRHSRDERMAIAERGIEAISHQISDKPYLMGDHPCGADAVVFGTITNMLPEIFDTKVRAITEGHPNLIAYRDRCMARWYPEFQQ
ncbi:MAG: glutathione S-transferase family protein [Pseudomonadota bacterium]